MKIKIAYLVSVLSFVIVYVGMDAVSDALGIPTYIDFGEMVTVTRGSGRYSYEEDIDGASTDVGWYIFIVSIMLAWRVWHWIVSGGIGGNIERHSHITWFYSLSGLSVFILITTPIWFIDAPIVVLRLIVVACGAAILWFFYGKHNAAIAKIKNNDIKGD